MKGTVQLIQANDDRHVLELPRQLELGFILAASSGGGRLKSQIVHPIDFTTICSIKALNSAWKKFSRCKKSRIDVSEFQKYLAKNINEIHQLLRTGEYTHGSYKQFKICDPKQRIIHKAMVQDRLVHQAIVSAVEPVFEEQFIYDSYSCRINKGTHAGVARLQLFLRRASHNNTEKVYVLKCDVRQFFASIDHKILIRLIEQKISDKQTLDLLKIIISSHYSSDNKGIPLGNVTSQLFANIYLHELDWFMKQKLGIKYYLRYCDDFVVISTNKEYLQSLIESIRQFLSSQLKLELHPNKVSIRPWDQGIDFLGYVSRPYVTSVRNKTKCRMLSRVNEGNISSYLGVCSHADGYRLSQIAKLVAWERQ
jgi:retron-type reverse transcriptase